MMIQKIRKLCVCICVACLSLTSGCATNPNRTANSPWAGCGMGAVAGGALGAGLGYVLGGGKGAAIGATAGLATGCAAGYMISTYLEPEEKRQYDASLSQNMSKTSINTNGTTGWQNLDGSKQVLTSFGKGSSLDQALAAVGSNTTLNKNIVASLPPNTLCRPATKKFSVNGAQAEEKGISCRNTDGDWIDVTSKTIA
ncbi:MAG: hypothetical protein ACXW0Q_11475 [Methylovulum sp.]|jgi:surface antigen